MTVVPARRLRSTVPEYSVQLVAIQTYPGFEEEFGDALEDISVGHNAVPSPAVIPSSKKRLSPAAASTGQVTVLPQSKITENNNVIVLEGFSIVAIGLVPPGSIAIMMRDGNVHIIPAENLRATFERIGTDKVEGLSMAPSDFKLVQAIFARRTCESERRPG